uniref:Selenoprotein W n=1 Tax=Chlorocebus sabaeus TaxID=60711 RepID=A0A0D9S2M2_CHLSB
MALAVRVVYWLATLGISGYKRSQYLQLKKKLEDEFPGRLDICGEGTPQATGFFEVMVAGKLIHSKKKGDGYVDTESKFLKLVAAIKAALAQG